MQDVLTRAPRTRVKRGDEVFVTVNLPRKYSSLVPKYDGELNHSVSFEEHTR